MAVPFPLSAGSDRGSQHLWIVSLLGFVAVALSFWGSLVPGQMCPPAVVPSIVSSLGIGLFFRTSPMFNTAAALGVNIVAVLVALLRPR